MRTPRNFDGWSLYNYERFLAASLTIRPRPSYLVRVTADTVIRDVRSKEGRSPLCTLWLAAWNPFLNRFDITRVISCGFGIGGPAYPEHMAVALAAQEAAVADIEYAGGALDTTTGLAANCAFPSGAHVAEVEIDPETGTTEVVRYTAVNDCGVVISPVLLEGQILGGMFQGLGQVLRDLCVYDAGGKLLTGSFMDYAMPRAEMLTQFSIGDSCVPSPNNPRGVKGAGEAGTTGALPAAMNAVLDALRPAGVTALDMPASAHLVWRTLSGM